MISEAYLMSLSNKYQTSELNIRREYIQHLFLSYLYTHINSGHIYFKGGTALRIIYQSPRFSEDLDFSAPLQDMHEIEIVMLDTIHSINREGIPVQITESKHTTGGYSGLYSFTLFGQSLSLLIEISERSQILYGTPTMISSDFCPSYLILQLRNDDLIGEKIQALLTRKKPRDFFDLYFLLRSNRIPPYMKHILRDALQILENSLINFETELKIFLPKSHWPIIRDFQTSLKREIVQNSI